MAIVILLLIFCGAMLLLDLMLCGFVKKMSNSKKKTGTLSCLLIFLFCTRKFEYLFPFFCD